MRFAVDLSVTEQGKKRPEYRIDTDLNGELTLAELMEFMKFTLIYTADEVLHEEQSKGFDKDPVVVVDGKKDANVRTVKPLGTIDITSRANSSEILLETYQGILGRSPVLSGEFKKSNIVLFNGRQVASDLSSFQSWLNSGVQFGEKDLVRFVNIQPYARKLEMKGVRAGNETTGGRNVHRSRDRKTSRGGKISVPNGTYFLTANSIKRKYKQNAGVKFSFISGTSLGVSGSFKIGRKGRPGRPYLYPTIEILFGRGGTL